MKSVKIISIVVLFLSVVGICAPPVKDKIVAKPGDVYGLFITGVPADESEAWSRDYKVDKDGCVRLPLGGKVKIGGMAIKEADRRIEKHLVDEEIYTTPKVKLTKRESK